MASPASVLSCTYHCRLEAQTPEAVATYWRNQLQLTSSHNCREESGTLCLLFYVIGLTIRFLSKQLSLDLNYWWEFYSLLSFKGSERFLEFYCLALLSRVKGNACSVHILNLATSYTFREVKIWLNAVCLHKWLH